MAWYIRPDVSDRLDQRGDFNDQPRWPGHLFLLLSPLSTVLFIEAGVCSCKPAGLGRVASEHMVDSTRQSFS